MDVIEGFLKRYEHEQDFYRIAAEICAKQCEDRLESEGIKAILSYREKNLDKLAEKIRKRNQEKKYDSVEQIYDDIVDLAGVRIALYFPNDRLNVGAFIFSDFDVVNKPKDFPEINNRKPSCDRRFSGYWATHFRVKLQKSVVRYM